MKSTRQATILEIIEKHEIGTQEALIEMLKEYGIDVSGKRCVVLGRSNIVGKPMATMLLQASGTVINYAVAAIIPVIGFYLQPAVGGRAFTYSYWERLCAIEGVVAIKAAPFNRYLTLDVARAAALSTRADEITLYTGNDDNILLDLLTEYRDGVNVRYALSNSFAFGGSNASVVIGDCGTGM